MLPMKYLDVLPRPGRSIWCWEMKIDPCSVVGLLLFVRCCLLSFLFHSGFYGLKDIGVYALSCVLCGLFYEFLFPFLCYELGILVICIIPFALAGSAGFAAHLKHQLSFDFIRYYIISVPAVHSA